MSGGMDGAKRLPLTADRLTLLSVHAHPDDEASKGAGSVARYHSEGVQTVLVCCTGGEEGDILNPEMDSPEVREIHPFEDYILARSVSEPMLPEDDLFAGIR